MNGWLTLDSIPNRIAICLSFPNSEEWRAQWLGAFLLLTKAENWEEFGALSPEEMADEWRSVFFDFINGGCTMIPPGVIQQYANETPPDGWLMCDGQLHLRADYPELYSVIGDQFGSNNGSTNFRVPDTRGKFAAGFGYGFIGYENIGATGGEANHTLTVAEMPSHSHVQNPSTVYANAGGNLLAGGSNAMFGGSSATQTTGGGSGHNNVPPYIALNYIIKV